MIKICLIDDDADALTRFRAVFGGEEDFALLGAFQNPEELFRELPRLDPEILLCDLEMPEMSGLDVIKETKKRFPHINAIALTCHNSGPMAEQVIGAGAMGYILKTEPNSRICDLVKTAARDGAALSAKISRRLIENLQARRPSDVIRLTARELEILRGIEKGSTYKQIASQTGVSVFTINNQAQKLFEKLSVRNKAGALQAAKRASLI